MIKRVIGTVFNNGTMCGEVETVEVVGNKVVFEKKLVQREQPWKRLADYEIFVVTENNMAPTRPCSEESAGSVLQALISNKMIYAIGGSGVVKVQTREILGWDRLVVDEFWRQFMKLKERYAPIDVEEEKKKAPIAQALDGDGGGRLYSSPFINNRIIQPKHVQTLLDKIASIVSKALGEYKIKNNTKELLGYNKIIVGKGGELDCLLRLLKFITSDSRTIVGQSVNKAHEDLQEAVSERMREFMPKTAPVVMPAATGIKEDWEKTLHPNCLHQYKNPLCKGIICKKCYDIIRLYSEDKISRAKAALVNNPIDEEKQDSYKNVFDSPDAWKNLLHTNCLEQHERPVDDGRICYVCQKVIDKKMSEFVPKETPVVFSSMTDTEMVWKDDKGNVVKTVAIPEEAVGVEETLKLLNETWLDTLCRGCRAQFEHPDWDGLICDDCCKIIRDQCQDLIPREESKAPFVSVKAEVIPAIIPTYWCKSAFNTHKHQPEPCPCSDETVTVNTFSKQISEDITLDFENDKSSEYFDDGEKYLIKNLKFSAIVPGTFDYTRVVDGKFKGSVWPEVKIESWAMGVIKCREPVEGYKNPITIRAFYDVDPILGIEKLQQKEITSDGFSPEDLEKFEKKLDGVENGTVEISKKTLTALQEKAAQLGVKLLACNCSCCNCVDDDSASKLYHFRDD